MGRFSTRVYILFVDLNEIGHEEFIARGKNIGRQILEQCNRRACRQNLWSIIPQILHFVRQFKGNRPFPWPLNRQNTLIGALAACLLSSFHMCAFYIYEILTPLNELEYVSRRCIM